LQQRQRNPGCASKARWDERTYEKGIKVSDTDMDAINICGDEFHPEWNYVIKPRTRKS
jgi:hypothetical protein